eukprot:19729-Eustigmatos_ZCMA.PRE.1
MSFYGHNVSILVNPQHTSSLLPSASAVVTASPHSSTATAAAPAMHGQSPIDLTLKDYDLSVDRVGVPPDTAHRHPHT